MVKNPPINATDLGLDPWVGKISWRREWQPTPVFLPGKSHGQRSMVGCSPWGCKKSQTHLATDFQDKDLNVRSDTMKFLRKIEAGETLPFIAASSFRIHLLEQWKKKKKEISPQGVAPSLLVTSPAMLLRGRGDGVRCSCRHSCCLEGVMVVI